MAGTKQTNLNLRNAGVLQKLRDQNIVLACPESDPLRKDSLPNLAYQSGDAEKWEIMIPDLSGIFCPEWNDVLDEIPHYRATRIQAMTASFGRFVVVNYLKPRKAFFLLPRDILVKVLLGDLDEEGLLDALYSKGPLNDS